MMDKSVGGTQPTSHKILTARQRQVLQLLADGHSMKETATLLSLTPRTIAFHKYKIMRDFDLRNNSDLIKFAMRQGVISPP